MAAQIGDAIEMVTVSEVWKIKMDNAAPKNIILTTTKKKMSRRLMTFKLERTPKSGGKMGD
jgi:hypothetical protein